MPNSVEGVIGEGKGYNALGGVLEPFGKTVDKVDNGGRVKGDTCHWRSKVCQQEAVEADAETNTGDSIRDTSEPGDLRLVDGKVWAGRAAKALLVKDSFGGRRDTLDLETSSCDSQGSKSKGWTRTSEDGRPAEAKGASDRHLK